MVKYERYINKNIGTVGPHSACTLLELWLKHDFQLTETEFELLWDTVTDFLGEVNDGKWNLAPDRREWMEKVAEDSHVKALSRGSLEPDDVDES